MTVPETAAAVLWAAALATTARGLRSLDGRTLAWWRAYMTVLALTGLAASLTARNWPAAGFCVACLALLARDWWNRRGKRAAKAVGAKSRALLAAVARRMREAGSPVPQGVGA